MKEKELFKQVSGEMLTDMKEIEAMYEQQRNKGNEKIENLCQGSMNKRKTSNAIKYRKRIIAMSATAAACLLVVCMPVMAKGAKSLWNAIIAKQVGADEEVQQQYEGTKLTQVFDEDANADAVTVAECNGVIVTLQQTFADDYGMRIYLDVNTNGEIPLTDMNLFDASVIYVDGNVWEGYDNGGGGFVEDAYAVSDTERTYELFYLNSKGIDLTGKNVTLELTDLLGDHGKQDFYTALEGTWKLQWNVSGKYMGETRTVDLKETKFSKYILEDIELSPISYTINYAYDGNGEDLFNDAMLQVAFIMKDGTIYNDETNPDAGDELWITGGGGGCSLDQQRESFVKVLDLENLKAIRINGMVFEIK